MFGSYILDIAIGLVFVYMLLSLLCSTINEQVIARIFSLRANTLEAGIQNMLNGRVDLTKEVYNNPLIQGLSRRRSPKLNALIQKLLRITPSEDPHKPSYIPSNLIAQAVMALSVVQVSKSNPAIPEALASLLQKANGNPQKELDYIEQWYDDTMDRVSGWYTRNVQLIIFFLGLAIVVILNVDTIAIITNISNDSVIRASLVSAVQGSAVSATNANSPTLQKAFEQIQPVIGWSSSNLPTNFYGWFLKIVGLLATTFAISLGAPFWFDLLNKFMSFRSSGPPAQSNADTGPSTVPKA